MKCVGTCDKCQITTQLEGGSLWLCASCRSLSERERLPNDAKTLAWKVQALSIKIDQDARLGIDDPELVSYRDLQAAASELAECVLQTQKD